MTDTSNLLQAGLDAIRSQTERDTLDRIAAGADEAASHALAAFGEDEWLGVEFAEALLMAARALRQAGRVPSPRVVEAMERCTAAHRAWAEVWGEVEVAEMAQALAPIPDENAAEAPADEADSEPFRIKVGLGDIVQTMLTARRS